MFFGRWFVFLLACVATPAVAQEKSAIREGLSTTTLIGQKIVLFRPSVWVGEQSTGGIPEPNADWTQRSRALIEAELKRRQSDFNMAIVDEPDVLGDDAKALREHKALFNSVAESIKEYQFFKGNRLPTRKNRAFAWTLGKGTSRIADMSGARYGLFISVNDQYGSFGRKMFQMLAAGFAGVGVKSGEHIGYAGLVELETGNIVWLNADGAMGGDVRTEEGVAKRVTQLLEDFPGLKVVSGR